MTHVLTWHEDMREAKQEIARLTAALEEAEQERDEVRKLCSGYASDADAYADELYKAGWSDPATGELRDQGWKPRAEAAEQERDGFLDAWKKATERLAELERDAGYYRDELSTANQRVAELKAALRLYAPDIPAVRVALERER